MGDLADTRRGQTHLQLNKIRQARQGGREGREGGRE